MSAKDRPTLVVDCMRKMSEAIKSWSSSVEDIAKRVPNKEFAAIAVDEVDKETILKELQLHLRSHTFSDQFQAACSTFLTSCANEVCVRLFSPELVSVEALAATTRMMIKLPLGIEIPVEVMNAFEILIKLESQTLFGPANLLQLERVKFLTSQKPDMLLIDLPIHLTGNIRSDFKIWAHAKVGGDHIQGSPMMIYYSPPNLEDVRTVLSISGRQNSLWTPLGSETLPKANHNFTGLDQSDLASCGIDKTILEKNGDVSGDENTSKDRVFPKTVTVRDKKSSFISSFQQMPALLEATRESTTSSGSSKNEEQARESGLAPRVGPEDIETKNEPPDTRVTQHEQVASKTWLSDNNETENPNDDMKAFQPDPEILEQRKLGVDVAGTPKTLRTKIENLPLDQPSPVAPQIYKPQRQIDDGDGQNGENFTPSVASTSANLAEMLRGLKISANKCADIGEKKALVPSETGAENIFSSIQSNPLDLKSSIDKFELKKKHPFQACAGQKVLLSSVSHDRVLNRTYVSDVGLNKIHFFENFDYKGFWSPDSKFVTPRYVQVVPSTSEVLVLDQKALHLFDGDGSIKKILVRRLAANLRGLAIDLDRGLVITVEKKTDTAPNLILIDLREEKVVERISLESEINSMTKAACRYLTYFQGKVYTTDLEMSCFYITDLSTKLTERVDLASFKLHSMTGVACDEVGNILIVSNGVIYMLDKMNNPLGPVSKFKVIKGVVTGIELSGKTFVAAGFGCSSLYFFQIH